MKKISFFVVIGKSITLNLYHQTSPMMFLARAYSLLKYLLTSFSFTDCMKSLSDFKFIS